MMTKEYLEKVVRPYGNDITSISFNGDVYGVGVFYDNFNVDKPNDVVFQVYKIEESKVPFDVDDVDDTEPNYNEYNQLELTDIQLVTVRDLISDTVVLYREVKL